MKRTIDYFLLQWKNRKERKSLLLRGARQVGKTYAARELGKTFATFIEINLETNSMAREILSKDLDVQRILFQLSELTRQDIKPGSTLLFIDEIQRSPQAIIALRYFFEQVPQLHVIAAGSLLDFAIEQVGVPVGRVTYLYMYPLSFLEFLSAMGHDRWVKSIISDSPLFQELHDTIMQLIGQYLAIGGMPAAINKWRQEKNSREVKLVHSDILNVYVEDFGAYSKKHQIKYLSLVFNKSMEQLSRKFMFSRLREYRKRELDPAIELLEKAGIIYQVFRNVAQGIPIGAGVELSDFKIIFLDVGLVQALLRYDLSSWFLNPPLESFINKGEVVEAFIGQELLAYSDPISKEKLYYWRKSDNSSQAEVDYLVQLKDHIAPVEVKSGTSSRLRSLHEFLKFHPHTKFGVRFSPHNESKENSILTYPLYAVAKLLIEYNDELKEALRSLVEEK